MRVQKRLLINYSPRHALDKIKSISFNRCRINISKQPVANTEAQAANHAEDNEFLLQCHIYLPPAFICMIQSIKVSKVSFTFPQLQWLQASSLSVNSRKVRDRTFFNALISSPIIV